MQAFDMAIIHVSHFCCICVACMAPQAKEFGEAEVWMNERMMRATSSAAAEFVTAFQDDPPGTASSSSSSSIWLLWRDEGESTLYDMMTVSAGALSNGSMEVGASTDGCTVTGN